jgi:fructoselysine 6-kinase
VRFLAIGDNCVDDYVEIRRRFPGGNALNVAVYANRIKGVHASYVGVIGSDEAGDFLLEQTRREGINTSTMIRLPGATAVTTILLRSGERIFADYIEGVQKAAEFPEELVPKLKAYDMIHYTINGFGREWIPSLKKTPGLIISCDFSSRLDDPATDVMPWLDYCFFSGRHLEHIGIDAEDKIKELKEQTPGVVVVTLGERGSLALDREAMHRASSINVKVVDTLGAGDAYIAAFLCASYGGARVDESMAAGHRAAAKACTRLGAWGGLTD